MGRMLAILAAEGRDGMTAGLIAKRVGVSKGWAHKLLVRLVASGDVFKCELPHGFNYHFTRTLYFTPNRMMEMNGGKLPDKSKVYIIRQRIATEIVGSNGDLVKSFAH